MAQLSARQCFGTRDSKKFFTAEHMAELREFAAFAIQRQRSPASTATLVSAIRSWLRFTARARVPLAEVFPVNDASMVFDFLVQTCIMDDNGAAECGRRVSALRAWHEEEGETTVLDEPAVAAALIRLQHNMAAVDGREPVRAAAFRAKHFQIMVDKEVFTDGLLDVQLWTLMCVAWAGLFRLGTLLQPPPLPRAARERGAVDRRHAQLRVRHLVRNELGYTVTLEKNKTNQHGAPTVVVLGASGTPWCAVAALDMYVLLLEAAVPAERLQNTPLFCRITRLGAGGAPPLWDVEKAWTRTCMLGRFKKKLTMAGIDEKLFGSQSFRAGGATEIACSGIDNPDLWIKRAGRWKSDIFQIYQRLSAEDMAALPARMRRAVAQLPPPPVEEDDWPDEDDFAVAPTAARL